MAPEVEGLAQVVEWRQVGKYAVLKKYVWLRRWDAAFQGVVHNL